VGNKTSCKLGFCDAGENNYQEMRRMKKLLVGLGLIFLEGCVCKKKPD
jgi:hypothetical protein